MPQGNWTCTPSLAAPAGAAGGRGALGSGGGAAAGSATRGGRHAHVFGDRYVRGTVSGAASVNELWESVKAAEKPRGSVLDGLPAALPALLYADKVLDRLARASRSRTLSAYSSAGRAAGSPSRTDPRGFSAALTDSHSSLTDAAPDTVPRTYRSPKTCACRPPLVALPAAAPPPLPSAPRPPAAPAGAARLGVHVQFP